MAEINTRSNQPNTDVNDNYEYSSQYTTIPFNLDKIYRCSISTAFSADEIRLILHDPIVNHSLTRKLAMFVYNSEGVVTNAIDYMVSLPCLDRVVYSKKRSFGKNKVNKNKDLMLSVLEKINDKQFIRDVLFTDMNEGTSFYYFETTSAKVDKTEFMRDYDVENIIEINDLGLNASMIPLPYEYCKIVGRRNGRYVVAFNLAYFDECSTSEEDKQRKLKKNPAEIRNAYAKWSKSNKTAGSWKILDNDHTIAHKIKCKISEPWGRPLAIAAIPDILYEDEFVDTKRNVLREINSRVVVQTFPEGKDKGSCALTQTQQKNQHEAVKGAIMTKNNKSGSTFVSVAAGTKIDSLKINDTDIFDEKNEKDLTDKIALDLGIAASLLNGSGSGNYSSQQHNLELINSQIYTWIQEIQYELNYVINACIIKDKRNKVEVYYLPTSLVNRDKFFNMMKSLYTEASGSLSFLIASAGITPDVYFNILDEEIENKIYDKYTPHQTAYTVSTNNSGNTGGRPTDDTSDNPSTIQTKANNSNNQPKPSTS